MPYANYVKSDEDCRSCGENKKYYLIVKGSQWKWAICLVCDRRAK